MYKFLAPRFLANGDSVVPVEGLHARWQQLEKERPGMKLVLLNSILKLHYAMHESGSILSAEELTPHVQDARLHNLFPYTL